MRVCACVRVRVLATPPSNASDAPIPLSSQVITGDEVADEYGVNKSSYDPVTLPNIKAYHVRASPSLDAARAAELGSMGLCWATLR